MKQSTPIKAQRTYRWLIHLLLAVFLANATNKFFIGDLDYERDHRFYEKIFAFEGEAPDQYRILPLLGIKAVRTVLRLGMADAPFNHAVLLFNFICGFLLFELFFYLLNHRPERDRYLFNFGFAILYIYTQYTGWRPDTLGLLIVGTALIAGLFKLRPGTPSWTIFATTGLLVLAFCRSDIAAIYAVFIAWTAIKGWPLRLALIGLPFAVQAFLQFYLFADATYYTKPVMIWDNLGGYHLAKNPATWLLAAFLLYNAKHLIHYIRASYRQVPVFYWLLAFYLVLVLFVGRLNEYRLYLPFLPLWMVVDNQLLKTSKYDQTSPTTDSGSLPTGRLWNRAPNE
ncbi:MAG: hypothetical protein AAF990_05360 [Bacteroidota bacterium]